MRYTARTDVGRKRENNEDNVFAKTYDDNTAIFVVADGLGGYSCGEVASKVCVNTVRDNFEANMDRLKVSDEYDIKQFLKQLIQIANEKIFSMQMANPKYKGMGTTVVLLAKVNGKWYYESVGDSRLYYIDQDCQTMEQITIDDTYVNELIKKKIIKKQEAENHPQKHVLTKALGIFEKIDVTVDILDKNNGYFILCSDGLTNMLSNEEILLTVKKNDILSLSDIFVEKANDNGGTDNITVVAVQI